MRMFTGRLDAKARTINRDARYWVVPFALDLDRYPLVQPPSVPTVGLIGSMHWAPSRTAAERLITRIWPIVNQRVPNARLSIAGWNADKHLARFAGTPGLTLQSNVNHPSDFFSQISTMVYAPGRGSGMKIKVMEAMAFGVPVVTTEEGVEGLAAESGVHCHVAETDADLAARIVELLNDRSEADRMRLAGRALIGSHYNPAAVVDRMMPVYEEIAAQ
jgi:glycosyltransferase involved in cell wall biosynthesis